MTTTKLCRDSACSRTEPHRVCSYCNAEVPPDRVCVCVNWHAGLYPLGWPRMSNLRPV